MRPCSGIEKTIFIVLDGRVVLAVRVLPSTYVCPLMKLKIPSLSTTSQFVTVNDIGILRDIGE